MSKQSGRLYRRISVYMALTLILSGQAALAGQSDYQKYYNSDKSVSMELRKEMGDRWDREVTGVPVNPYAMPRGQQWIYVPVAAVQPPVSNSQTVYPIYLD